MVFAHREGRKGIKRKSLRPRPSSPRPQGGYALPGQGDRSPPKQAVGRGLGRIESAPAVFGYFPPVESTAPQAMQKTVTASARLFGVFTASRCDGRSFNPTFLLCKRKVPLTVPKKTSRGCSESPPAPPQLPLFRGETYGFLPCRGGITPLSLTWTGEPRTRQLKRRKGGSLPWHYPSIFSTSFSLAPIS